MMTNIKLINMKIANFKGISNREINFDGVNMNIYGRNFIGKTSIYDAFCWILFDKDSSCNKNFDIKPLDENNKVRYPGADTTVAVKLTVDGEITELKKVYHEVWTQQRGSADKALSGHTSEYYIDDIPVKKTEFGKYIDDLIDETQFKILTNVYMFCEEMNWQERRKILFEMCGIADDLTLMAQVNKFDELIPHIGKYTIDTYKASITGKRKSLVTDKNKIPESISAYTAVMKDAMEIDYKDIEVDKSLLEDKVKSLTTKIIEIKNDTAISKLTNEYNSLSNNLAALETENTAYRNGQAKTDDGEYTAQKNDLNSKLSDLIYKQKNISAQIDYESSTAERLNRECSRIRSEYNKPSDDSDEVCPTCKRIYDISDLEKIRTNKNKYRTELRNKGLELKKQVETAETNITRLNSEKEDIGSQIDAVKTEIGSLKTPEVPVIRDMDNYITDKKAIQAEQADIRQRIDDLKTESSGVLSKLQAELTMANNELKSVNDQLAQRSVIADMQRRIDNLMAQERELAAQIEDTDKHIYLCEEFTKYKISFVEQSINEKFNVIRFKLFREQINGGIEDCCEVLYKGVPFGTNASRSEQINAALDVIQTLSDFYEVRVPLFIDNAESVTDLYDIDTQVIRLVVSENDKEMRIEPYVIKTEKKTANANPAA